ncbi:MAG: NUDIX hydrolase [Gemmatimonadaceae bacterium]
MTPLDAFLDRPEIARLVRALAAHPGRIVRPAAAVRLAATAAMLRLGDSGPELLLIRRAKVERDPWSGHVAWPGGHMEPTDPDLAATAVRETLEETHIDLGRQGRILGTLDDIHPRTPVLPPILVRPFVAAVAGDTVVTPSSEVADYTWVPFGALLDERHWGTAPIAVRTLGVQERPVFRYGDYQVWGMTEYMLRQLVTRYRETD